MPLYRVRPGRALDWEGTRYNEGDLFEYDPPFSNPKDLGLDLVPQEPEGEAAEPASEPGPEDAGQSEA